MYEVERNEYVPDKFLLAGFPHITVSGTLKSGQIVKKYSLVVAGENGIEVATKETLEKIDGIAADDFSDGTIIYYQTGKFSTSAIELPTGVTIEDVRPILRKISIFLD